MPLGHARGAGTTKGKLRRNSIEHAPKYHLTPFSGSQKKTSNNSLRISDWRTNESSQSKASALLTENQGDRHLQAHRKIQLHFGRRQGIVEWKMCNRRRGEVAVRRCSYRSQKWRINVGWSFGDLREEVDAPADCGTIAYERAGEVLETGQARFNS
jgi:hypothetical protein